MLHLKSMGRVQSKECYFKFAYTFLAFFVVFHQKFVFLSFPFLFLKKCQINQLETGIGDKKL